MHVSTAESQKEAQARQRLEVLIQARDILLNGSHSSISRDYVIQKLARLVCELGHGLLDEIDLEYLSEDIDSSGIEMVA